MRKSKLIAITSFKITVKNKFTVECDSNLLSNTIHLIIVINLFLFI